MTNPHAKLHTLGAGRPQDEFRSVRHTWSGGVEAMLRYAREEGNGNSSGNGSGGQFGPETER